MARLIREKKQKTPKSITSPVNEGNKLVIFAAVAIVLVFLLAVIGMGFLFTNVIGRFAEDDTSSGQVTTITYSMKTRGNYGSYGSAYTNTNAYAYDLYGDEGADMNGETTLPKVTSKYGTGSEFQYGRVTGTKYHSDFSGMTFDAPSGWTLNGVTKSDVTATTILDLDAYNAGKTMTVKLQYFALSGGNYTSTKQVLNALKAQVGSETEIESKSKSIAGNNFSGFAFDGMNGNSVARSEVLVAEVKGYALVLQVVAPTQNDVNSILKNFS